MDLKDFRAAAYLRNTNNNSQKPDDKIEKDDKAKTVKSVAFPKLSRSELEGKQEAQLTHKEVKAFVPKSFTSQLQSQSQTQKKASIDQALENATNYLKDGGLLKVPVEAPLPDGKDSVYRRVAKFLLLIGEDEAAKILPHLSEKQIERIIPEIASIRTVDKDEAQVILEEFNGLMNKSREQGGLDTAREMLEKAYGKARADQMIKKAIPLEGKIPFVYLNDADNERVYQLLKDENPGVQSLVLSHLEPKKAAKVINLMKPEEKKK